MFFNDEHLLFIEEKIALSLPTYMSTCVSTYLLIYRSLYRRARKRSREQLIEETKQKRRELETKLSHHSAPQYMNDTVNSAPSLPPRSNGGGSLARSDTVPQKMAGYRLGFIYEELFTFCIRQKMRFALEAKTQ